AYFEKNTDKDNFVEKFRIFFKNRTAVVLTSLYLLHVIGLLYTTDFDYALKDLRTKIPLLLIPLYFATNIQFERKRFETLLLIFVWAVFAGTFCSSWAMLSRDIINTREASLFIDHIRFSLMICLAIFILIYFIQSENYLQKYKIIFAAFALWFIVFLFWMQWFTGIAISLISSLFLAIYLVVKIKNIFYKSILLVFFILTPILITVFISTTIKEYNHIPKIKFENLEKLTASGNPYVHDIINYPIENGKYIGLYISWKELKDEWNKRSKFDFNGNDKIGQNIKYTILRYLTSKDLRKDAEGIRALTEKDIEAIENGVANIHYNDKVNFRKRLYVILWEYNHYKMFDDPSGHSVTQRFEFWKTSVQIIKDNWLIGVGTGDMNSAFEKQYIKMNSNLSSEWRLRSHNQYLSITVGFGMIGFLWFLIFIFYPPIREKKLFDYLYFIFLVIILLSMLTEDTIESQAGVTLFAFFNSFLLLGRKKENQL
ncbi:MAG: O-antigen ligase family protein, partial [Saprospiraceae bacterium]|nr:O-antigen ligase family protein [Saprospiraceae bacterium]